MSSPHTTPSHPHPKSKPKPQYPALLLLSQPPPHVPIHLGSEGNAKTPSLETAPRAPVAADLGDGGRLQWHESGDMFDFSFGFSLGLFVGVGFREF